MLSPLSKDIDRIRENVENGNIPREEAAEILRSARYLTSTLETTEGRAWRVVMGPVLRTALISAVRIGVFDVFKEQSSTAAEIAEKTNADRLLVVRLMRALLVASIFEEIGEEIYAQNELSKFFSDKSFQDFMFLIEFNDTLLFKLPDFLKTTNFRNPVDPNNGLLQYACNTKMKTTEWLEANPETLEIIGKGMMAQGRNWRNSDRSALSSVFPLNFTSDILIVDVGGGRGLTLEELRTYRPDLKGRMIFQDVPGMIAGRENIPGVEAMAHDFFQPQPIKGASVYLIRNVLHDWPDETNQEILRNTISALGPHSRVVIQDQVVPTTGASLLNVSVDITMMNWSGMERSEKQWRALLGSVGLGIVKIIPPEPHANFSTIEAVLQKKK